MIPDDDLIEVAKADHQAFDELYQRHRSAVYAVVAHYGLHGADADDVVSETFLRALAHLDGFRCGGSFIGWLGRIARNIIFDQSRRAARRHELDLDDMVGLADGRPPVEDWVASRDLIERIWAAVDRLPQGQRQALILRWGYDLPATRICEITGRSPLSVDSLLWRGMDRLRAQFRAA